VHIRRGDFKGWCPEGIQLADCFAPLSDYDEKVQNVQNELRDKGVIAKHVLVTSDETNPKWWSSVEGMGWFAVDHNVERTEELYGKWYVDVLAVISQAY
jgi:hypothetical protein